MNSQEGKVAILNEFLFKKSCLAAVTEGPWNSDVFVVTKNRYSIDIEVKVNREDLLNEMHTIDRVMKQDHVRLRQRGAKYHKHDAYLNNRSTMWDGGVPNSFYLAFPKELYDHRLEMLRGTPYGILLLDGNTIEVYKKAEKIHKNKITDASLIGLIRKACTENYFLRAKLLEKGVEYDVPKTE